MSEAQELVGQISTSEHGREVIHVVIRTMLATREMRPGEHLADGIVDPFLRHPVWPGDRYWLFEYPNSQLEARANKPTQWNKMMKSEWRTNTVVQLCQAMREGRDFSALPLLARVLKSAGCDDEDLVKSLHENGSDVIEAQRLVALVYSEETASAVRWMAQWGKGVDFFNRPDDCRMNAYEDAMWVGNHVDDKEVFPFLRDTGKHFNCQPTANRREYFRNWSLITGILVQPEDQDRIETASSR
jgi:hypothetical protein